MLLACGHAPKTIPRSFRWATHVCSQPGRRLRASEALGAMGVDLTAYLTALAAVPPDQTLKIDTGGGAAGANPPALHLELPSRSKR